MPDPTITFDPVAVYDGVHTFDLTGTTQGIAPKSQLYLYASTGSDPGVSEQIDTTLVQFDGTFDFKDILPSTQNYIYASFYDVNSKQKYFGEPSYSLDTDRHVEDVYSPIDGSYQYEVQFSRDGATAIDVGGSGADIPSFTSDTFNDHRQADNTFVFQPYHGHDIIEQFRARGPDHDALSFAATDFGGDLAQVLANTRQLKGGGSLIVDPTTGDTVRLVGISKNVLAANQGDFTLHA